MRIAIEQQSQIHREVGTFPRTLGAYDKFCVVLMPTCVLQRDFGCEPEGGDGYDLFHRFIGNRLYFGHSTIPKIRVYTMSDWYG